MTPVRTVIVAVAVLGLGACANTNIGEKEGLGTLLGAALGGLAGSQIGDGTGQMAAVGAGVLLGGLLGNEMGKSLDRADQAYAAQTYSRSLEKTPTGKTSGWRNPDSGNSGTYTPTRTFQKTSGQYCREFQQTITVGGETQQAYGTACRKEDGTWQIVSN
ncbi:MAG: RT0821/Lpp0805 family surface protein [Alphaproteobacteria bacterium]|nr:RT0821/Lpp0805 family surface protein [Alphaproteobacteria bacterium]MDP6515230.1 RT0821/Lpp0805 family surface protein [Alphaproteobacteria bacterium]